MAAAGRGDVAASHALDWTHRKTNPKQLTGVISQHYDLRGHSLGEPYFGPKDAPSKTTRFEVIVTKIKPLTIQRRRFNRPKLDISVFL